MLGIHKKAARGLVEFKTPTTETEVLTSWREVASKVDGERTPTFSGNVTSSWTWSSRNNDKILKAKYSEDTSLWVCNVITNNLGKKQFLEIVFKKNKDSVQMEFAVPDDDLQGYNELLKIPRDLIAKFDGYDGRVQCSNKSRKIQTIEDIIELARNLEDERRTMPIVVLSENAELSVDTLTENMFGIAHVATINDNMIPKMQEIFGKKNTPTTLSARIFDQSFPWFDETRSAQVTAYQNIDKNAVPAALYKACVNGGREPKINQDYDDNYVESAELKNLLEAYTKTDTPNINSDKPEFTTVIEKRLSNDQRTAIVIDNKNAISSEIPSVDRIRSVIDENSNRQYKADIERILARLENLEYKLEIALEEVSASQERIEILEQSLEKTKLKNNEMIVNKTAFDDMLYIAEAMVETGNRVYQLHQRQEDNESENARTSNAKNDGEQNNHKESVSIVSEDNKKSETKRTFPQVFNLPSLEAYAKENLDNLVFHPRAKRAVKKSNHQEPQRIYRILQVLNDYYAPMRSVNSEIDMKAFEKSLEPLYCNVLARKDSNHLENHFKVLHNGKAHAITHEIRSNSSPRNKKITIRVYFFWDESNKKVVICHLPEHLPTTEETK